uniref:hypothetical protein n=1 Tax=uncultured Prevotella sp. TaxID=159272 RepID=UPI0026015C45
LKDYLIKFLTRPFLLDTNDIYLTAAYFLCMLMTQKLAAPVFKIAQNIKFQRCIAKITVQRAANKNGKFILRHLQGRKNHRKKKNISGTRTCRPATVYEEE